MRKIILLFIGVFWSSFSFSGTCTSITPQDSSIDFGNITVQRDTPIGTVLFHQAPSITEKYVSGCTNPLTLGFTMLYNSGVLSSYGNNVYNTNVIGVGIRVSNNPYFFSNPMYITSYNSSSNYMKYFGGMVELIKTGDITSGNLLAGDVAKISILGEDTLYHDGLKIATNGGLIAVLACSINTTNIQVPLDDVLASDLTLIGTTAKPKIFNVGLNCDAGARVNAMLTGTRNTDTATAGVLQLTNAGSAGVATGVGIQILYNNIPLALNNNIVLKTSVGGQEAFPFTAQYYQTKNTTTAGSANAMATLNLTYQ